VKAGQPYAPGNQDGDEACKDAFACGRRSNNE